MKPLVAKDIPERKEEIKKNIKLIKADINNEYVTELEWAKLAGINDPAGHANSLTLSSKVELYKLEGYLECLNDFTGI